MTVKLKNSFLKNNYAIFPYNLTFAYAIAVALAGKANEINNSWF